MTSGVAGCSTMRPPVVGFARSVRGWESGESRPDSRSVPSTLQTIAPVVMVVQASLRSRSYRFGSAQCAFLKASTRAQRTSTRPNQAIDIFKSVKQIPSLDNATPVCRGERERCWAGVGVLNGSILHRTRACLRHIYRHYYRYVDLGSSIGMLGLHNYMAYTTARGGKGGQKTFSRGSKA